MAPIESAGTYSSPSSRARILRYGAQVMGWAPTGEDDVLWRSRRATMRAGEPVRGGIPICMPWFAGGPHGDARPVHGFARTRYWELGQQRHTPTSASVRFDLNEAEPCAPTFFPHRFHAAYSVALTDDLVATLRVRNIDSTPFAFEEALHAYFAVGDVKDVTIDGLAGRTYVDAAHAPERRRAQFTEVTFVEETDRIYDSSESVVIHDPRKRRHILVDKAGSADWIVWNPWVEGARRAPDMDDRAWQDFVCVEAANVREHAVHLEPGEEHALILDVHVDPMA